MKKAISILFIVMLPTAALYAQDEEADPVEKAVKTALAKAGIDKCAELKWHQNPKKTWEYFVRCEKRNYLVRPAMNTVVRIKAEPLWVSQPPPPPAAPPSRTAATSDIPIGDLKTMTATILNVNGLLCAEVVSIRPLQVRADTYEVICVEYRGGSSTKTYIMDAARGTAWPA